jgi:hypothetical protein
VSAAERKRRKGKGEVVRCGDLGWKNKWARGEERDKLGRWAERERGEVKGFSFFNLFKLKHFKLFSKFSKNI